MWFRVCAKGRIPVMFYVYVLLSLKDEKFYIGFTGDLRRRLKEHNAGKNISTKSRRPLKLTYYEAHLSKADAERRERYFKTTKGKITLKQMLRSSLDKNGI
jgi:putative endonuclease